MLAPPYGHAINRRAGSLTSYSSAWARGYFAFLMSPFFTPASGNTHMATIMNTAVIMM
jgi:hypothetical protein